MKRILLILILTVISINHIVAQNINNHPGRIIKIETTLGDIRLLLYNETPLHQKNMIKLIEEGYYDGQIFHRVIENFMIQGGDPHSKDAERGQRLGTGGPGYKIPSEFSANLFHKKGALAAAREGDRKNPKQLSSGSQFYIVKGRIFTIEELDAMIKAGRCKPLSTKQAEIYTTIGGTPHLDGAYTVFGEVIEGIEIVDLITYEPTDSYDRPLQNITYKISIEK